MKFLLLFSLIVIINCDVPIKEGWKEVKFPWDSPHFKDVMRKLYPYTPKILNNRNGRIAGGELAYLGQFPYQTLLYNVDEFGDTFICGGAIISHNYILTAAHCLFEIVRSTVYAGVIDRIRGPAVWTLDVTSASGNFIIHEDYAGVVNDIALIRLVSSIPSHNYISIIALPHRSDINVDLVGKSAIIAGFGRSNDITTQPSEQLKFITQSILSNSVCEGKYGKTNVRDTNLCLGGDNGKSTCQGDSGGPLVTDLTTLRKGVVGIVSFGAEIGCTLGHPVVFTRVTKYLDWIEKNSGIFIYN